MQSKAQTPVIKPDTIITATLHSYPTFQLNQPLCFLNGKKFSMDSLLYINPETIESIEVLKGPTAIEQYSDAGKNGVLLIKIKETGPAKKD